MAAEKRPPGPPPRELTASERVPPLAEMSEDGLRDPEEYTPPAPPAGADPSEVLRGRTLAPERGGPTFDAYVGPEGQEHFAALYPMVVNYQDSEGNWRKIADSLAPHPEGGWTNAGGAFTVRFPEEMAPGAAVTFQIPEGSLTTQPVAPGALGRVRGSVQGGTLAYRGVLPGVDLEYSLHSAGFKETVVLTSHPGPSTLAYDIQAQGLSLEKSPTGEIRVLSAGQVVGFIPTPVAYDSSPTIDESVPATTLTDLGGGHYVLEVHL
ncbi:MAG: hypothetical protein HY658_13145, partial [Actinobacteria bacterium]|nr:hypothetical protein [Actinomycetota bacterium]